MVVLQVWKAHVAMVFTQVFLGSGHVVIKLALNNGVNQFVFCAFRVAIALLVLTVIAFSLERNAPRPTMTLRILAWLMFLGLTGVFGSVIFFIMGLSLTLPVYGAATQPLIPLFTFLLALITQTEKLMFGEMAGKLKVSGIFICMAGATIVTFYKGPSIVGATKLGFFNDFHLGMLCFLANTISMALYIALQAPLLEIYPATWTITSFAYLFGTLFMGIAAYINSSTISDWILTPLQLGAAIYMGVFPSAVSFALITMCTTSLGPTLVALYMPIQLVVAPILSYIVLKSPLYVGSLVGGIVIALGFYSVLWGRQMSINQRLSEPILQEEECNRTRV